jgi:hypothetical protein
MDNDQLAAFTRPITRGQKVHWLGYYDKLQFDPTGRCVLGMEVDFENRSPHPDGHSIAIDSVHDGNGRQMYPIDVKVLI